MNEPERKNMFRRRVLTPFAALLLMVMCVGITAAVCLYQPNHARTDEQLYRAAVLDALTIEDGEILPVVTITAESNMVTWQHGKVLLLTINRHPERYTSGMIITLPDEVWTFTDRELAAWYAVHKNGVTDWPRRFKQLIGVPPDGVYTHVTAMWVMPDDIIRPAYNVDIASPVMFTTLPKETSEEYKVWFNSNIIWSYFDSAYPWTRLGYTYDWSEGSPEYGLSEFLVRRNARVEVLYTDTISEFIGRLERGETAER